MAWQGKRKRKCSSKREHCDGKATWLCVFTSHVWLGVTGTPVATTRLGRKASSLPLTASQRDVTICTAVFSLSRTSGIGNCSN